MKRNYGWKRDIPDIRDVCYAPRISTNNLPSRIDLRDEHFPIFNQGNLGSCTANAISTAHYFSQIKQKAQKAFVPSRLFIYYNERAMEGTINSDAGAVIRNGFKCIAKLGVCSEDTWKYKEDKFSEKPIENAYTIALDHQVIKYMKVVQMTKQLKGCLAEGYPFVFGFTVYDSFESDEVARTGIMSLPEGNESCMGGHAVMCVGYDDEKKVFIVQNSWGKEWGDKGYFYMPYSYITNPSLASDFWTIRTIEV